MNATYEAVIGLEVHAQLATRSKLFCGCRNAYGEPPNTLTCPVCLGHPGVLPVLNAEAVTLAATVVLAVGGRVNGQSAFARKNYFYPDLPKGYQITQYDRPLGVGGEVRFAVADGGTRPVGISRVHLEEDAAKLVHGEPNLTHIDFNRCGVPLVEIVSGPALSSPQEAVAYLMALKQVLEYAGVSHADMEKGELRCDANLSVRLRGDEDVGVRTEIKNLNSFRSVQRALEFELERHIDLLQSGKPVQQVTMLWDEENQTARVMRTKEESEDYRYFDEPDLPEIMLSEDWIESIRSRLPELADERRERLVTQYGIRRYDAEIITGARSLADYFERVMAGFDDGQTAANWIVTNLLAALNQSGKSLAECPVKPNQLSQLLRLVRHGSITGNIAKIVFAEMLDTGGNPEDIIAARNLAPISDEAVLLPVIGEVLAGNESSVDRYLSGKEAVFGFLVGQIMRATGGRADPEVVARLLKDRLRRLE